MTISGEDTVTIEDLLIGEVWVCSGQSNMERALGPAQMQQPIVNWEAESAAAHYPQIRQFHVDPRIALIPPDTVTGRWTVCNPETVLGFTAVGYFFARDLFKARRVPIGLIHSSWGGSPAEAWTPEAALQALPEYTGVLAQARRASSLMRRGTYDYARQLADWYRQYDIGTSSKVPWSAPEFTPNGWNTVVLPSMWTDQGLPGFHGIVWFRRIFDLPKDWVGRDLELHFSSVADADTTWINGVKVGGTPSYWKERTYPVPASVLRSFGNTIAVRVLNTGAYNGHDGKGGFPGSAESMKLSIAHGSPESSIPLSGVWQQKDTIAFEKLGPLDLDFSTDTEAPMVLFNGMIAPIQPYAIRGVLWYQGESNVARARQYRSLFPAMIAEWRRTWAQGEFPFLFVQIAPHKGILPELREAQWLTWRRTTNTAMVVTVDCGDAEDIHPANKQPVGSRLALAARALAYGERIEYSGPAFESFHIADGYAIVRFTHIASGLRSMGTSLTGFTVCGPDHVYHSAQAEIQQDTVVLSAKGVPNPVAVRYGWSNVPDGNLVNSKMLPASPFRTDIPTDPDSDPIK